MVTDWISCGRATALAPTVALAAGVALTSRDRQCDGRNRLFVPAGDRVAEPVRGSDRGTCRFQQSGRGRGVRVRPGRGGLLSVLQLAPAGVCFFWGGGRQ